MASSLSVYFGVPPARAALAAGAGSAYGATAKLSPSAGASSGTGAAQTTRATISGRPDVAIGTGIARQASTGGTTLQALVNAATAGSTLDLTGSTYSAGATISKALTLKGCTITVAPGQKGIIVAHDDVILESLTINGPGASTYTDAERGIEANGAYNGLLVQDCVIDGIRGWGMYLRSVVAPTIGIPLHGNTVSNIGYIGIGFLSVPGGAIAYNDVSHIGENTQVGGSTERNAYGIVLTSPTGVETQSSFNLVDRNTVSYVPNWHGFDCHAAISPTFTNNTTHHIRKGFFLTSDNGGRHTTNLSICTGNTMTNPYSPFFGNPTGITTYLVQTGTITGNIITGWGLTDGAIYDYTAGSTGMTVSGNTIS